MAAGFARRAVCISLLGALLAACSADVSRDEIVGDYQINHDYGTETLRLSADGGFVQAFRKTDADDWATQTGAWELQNGTPQEVRLHGALRIDDGSGKLRADYRQPIAGDLNLQVKNRLGTISLLVDAQRGFAMTRLEPPPASDHKPVIVHRRPPDPADTK